MPEYGIPPSGGISIDSTYLGYNQNGELTIKDEVPLGVSTGDYNELMLQILNDIAENKYANSLNADSFDELFVDPFVDQSLIASSNNINITTGKNGEIKLKTGIGSTSSVTQDDTVSFVTDTNAGMKFKANNDLDGIKATTGPNTENYNNVQIIDSNSNVLAEKTGLNGTTNQTFEFTGLNLQSGNTYYVIADNEGNDWSYDEYLSGTSENSATSTDIDITGNNGSRGGSTDVFVFGSITAIKGHVQSGTITSTTKNLGYTPSAFIVQEDSTITSGEDVQFTFSDNSGNSKTISQSQIGEEVSVNFGDGDITSTVELSGDGSSTPTVEEYGWKGVR